MIKQDSYSEEWLFSHREKEGLQKINPPLVEKMIHALSLVEQLAMHGLNFVFKGGTSLVLLLEDAGRFSIDIDIITQASRKEIEDILQKLCDQKPFKRFELSEHRSYKKGIPKAHYSLFYYSALNIKEDHILLDILYEEHSYPELLELPVKTQWLATEGQDTLVKVPSPESIAGDKLTAFAPTTTGILYGKGKEVEIIKQLHDVDKLYHQIKDLGVVAKAFNLMVEKEIKYRGNQCSREGVFTDIVETAAMIAKREKNTEEPHKSYFKEIKLGLLQFKSYQTTSAFRIEEAITGSAKAALLAAKIKAGHTDALPKFEPGIQKNDYLIQHPAYLHLNKLPVEALYYWHHTILIFYSENHTV
jgi:hypothetical protein